MSLRDFNGPDVLHNVPLGNGAGLDSFHTRQPEDVEPNNMPKIVGAVAVALMVGAAGVALYASAGKSAQPKPVMAANNLPAPPPPAPIAMAPDADMPATTPPAASETAAPALAPAPAPVKTVGISRAHKTTDTEKSISPTNNSASGDAASARMAADSSQVSNQPQQQAAIIAPSPSPSDVASNNTQSNLPQSAAVAPQETQSSAPQASNAAPVQDQETGATPAPAQPPAQSAGQVNQ